MDGSTDASEYEEPRLRCSSCAFCRPCTHAASRWAFAKLGVTPPEALLAGAAEQMLDDLGRCVPQDLSNSLWAYASLRWSPGSALLDGAARHAALSMPRFKPQVGHLCCGAFALSSAFACCRVVNATCAGQPIAWSEVTQKEDL